MLYSLKKLMLSKRIIGVCIFLILLTTVSCNKEKSREDKLSIAVIPKGTTHVFWQSIHAGALKAASELDIKLNWIGPEKEDDRQQQIALVDNQVINQVSGIVLAPIDNMALRRPVQSAVRKEIPVVIIDSGLKDAEDIYTSYVATDNKEGGRIGGSNLARLLNGKGKVIVLREIEGATSTEGRVEGFLEAVSEYPDIEIVSKDQYVGVTKAQAQQASENFILRFSDKSGALTIDGIFCPNESTTYGMMQALRRRRLSGTVKFVGFDSSPPLIEGLVQSEISGLVVQNPFKMGYLGVQTIVNYIQGKEVPKYLDTGVTFVTVDNMNNPDIKELLFPDLERWIGK